MRKLSSVILSLALCFSLCAPAFAADNVTATPISEATIQAEIDLKTAEILESAYRQLEAQDALGLWDDCVEILQQDVAASVYAKIRSGRSLFYKCSAGH